MVVVLPSLTDPIFFFSFVPPPCSASVLWSPFLSSASRQHERDSFSEHSPVSFCLLFVLAPGHILLVYKSGIAVTSSALLHKTKKERLVFGLGNDSHQHNHGGGDNR